MESSRSGLAHKQQAVCQPLPTHPVRAWTGIHTSSLRSVQVGVKGFPQLAVPTGLCWPTGTIRHIRFQDICFVCVSLYTVACTHTHIGGVCVSSRRPCRSSALCNPRGWCLRQCLYGERSAGSIFKAVLGSQHAPAFHSTGTSTPVSGPGNAPVLWEVCASSGRPDGSSRSSCGMG